MRRWLNQILGRATAAAAPAPTGPPWLDGPGSRSTDEMLALEGRYRTDSLVVAFETGLKQKAARVGFGGLSNEERTVLAVEAVEREVNNGGFNQLFLNLVPGLTPELVPALTAIDRADIGKLVTRAMRVLKSTDALALHGAAANSTGAQDEKLDALDDAYYAVAGDLAEPLLAYIKANRDAIVL